MKTDNRYQTSSGWRNLFSPFHVGLQLLVAVLFFSARELDRIFNLWFALVLVVGLPTILVGIIWTTCIIKTLIQRHWMKFTSLAIAPLIVWPIFVLLLHFGLDSHWIRFEINKSNYEETVRGLTGPHPIYKSWDWGQTGGAAAANIEYLLVYDESDLVARKEKDRNSGGFSVRDFNNHFYLITRTYF